MNLNKMKILYVYTHGRNGSLFFQSLINDHKNVIAFPVMPFDSYDFFTKHLNDDLDVLIENVFKDTFVQYVAYKLYNPVYPFENVEFDRDRFRAVFLKEVAKERSVKNYIESFYIATADNYNIPLDDKFYILENLHAPLGDLELDGRRKCFSDVFVLHIFRDPKKVMLSHFAFLIAHNYDLTHGWFLSAVRQIEAALLNVQKYKSFANYHIVKLEDLRANPEKVMRDVCKKTGLEFAPSLLQSTFFEKPWVYQSASGVEMKGFNGSPAYKHELSFDEKNALESLFLNIFEDLNYPLETPANFTRDEICAVKMLNEGDIRFGYIFNFGYLYGYDHLFDRPIFRLLERLRVLKPLIIFRRFVKNIVFILRYKAKKCAVVESVLALRDEIRAANGRSSGAGSSTGSGAGSNVGSSTGSNSAQGAQEAQGKQTAQDAAGFMGAGANFAGSNAARSSTGSGARSNAGSSTRSSAPAQTRTPTQSGKNG